jgi:dTDP-4-dehydrorhamnose 3,5-epimerase-like enzyme
MIVHADSESFSRRGVLRGLHFQTGEHINMIYGQPPIVSEKDNKLPLLKEIL